MKVSFHSKSLIALALTMTATMTAPGCSSVSQTADPAVTTVADPQPISVDVVRDDHGVPHIYAADLETAMYGLGYATAEDRLFQMELKRRVMRGRMAETLGAGENDRWLRSDRFHRIVGQARHADAVVSALPTDVQAMLEVYAKGVDAYVSSASRGAAPVSGRRQRRRGRDRSEHGAR